MRLRNRPPAAFAAAVPALGALAGAAAGTAGETGSRKAGSAIVPPPLPGSARELASLARARATIVALVRGRGGAVVLRDAGAELLSPSLALWRLTGPRSAGALAELARRRALRYVEPDVTGERPADHWQQGDTLLEDQAELDTIRADLEPPGPGVPITVIDSGVDLAHPEFAGRPDTRALNRQATRSRSPRTTAPPSRRSRPHPRTATAWSASTRARGCTSSTPARGRAAATRARSASPGGPPAGA